MNNNKARNYLNWYIPAQGKSLSSLMACRSHLFLALCCGNMGGGASGTSGGVLLVILLDFLGGRFLSRAGVRGGDDLAFSSLSRS